MSPAIEVNGSADPSPAAREGWVMCGEPRRILSRAAARGEHPYLNSYPACYQGQLRRA